MYSVPSMEVVPVAPKSNSVQFYLGVGMHLCLTAIISGIIIDSFGEKQAAWEAQKNFALFATLIVMNSRIMESISKTISYIIIMSSSIYGS